MTKILSLTSPFLILIFLFTTHIEMKAQADTLKNLPNLVMPRFTKAVVKLKTGGSYNAVMNYEKTEQQMIVLRKGQYFVLKDQNMADTVIIGERIFVPFENGFYEVLVNAPVSLFMQHRCKLESEGSTVAYGTKTTTAGITHITTIYGKEGAIDLKIPENYKVVDVSETWIRKEDTMNRVSNKRQFMKLFEDRESDLTQFIKQHNIDFRNPEDLTSLVLYCNGLK